jgi:triphosphoribosyl-dephospho-CoA synthase
MPMTSGQRATLACLLEVTASKPGNVHRGADFENLTFADFALSAVAIGPAFESPTEKRLGTIVLEAVRATRAVVDTNTNLGMVLLMAPLAMVPEGASLGEGVRNILANLDADDARLVYEAIRLAKPGGMGLVEEADLADIPPFDLVEAMRLAADRDMIARQYANGFADVIDMIVPALAEGIQRGWGLNDVIIRTHLTLMQKFPDSLIARKCGREVAEMCAAQAGEVLGCGEPGDDTYNAAVADFDFWLRADGHQRNPGTSADLVAAGLFAALGERIIEWPLKFY